MPEDVPDLSAGPKVSELSHAAMAAVQIASSRREAIDRARAERVREADQRRADLERLRPEWRRLADRAGRALDRRDETRLEANYLTRVSAISRLRHDGAILDYQEAIDAPVGSVTASQLDRLERAIPEAARQSELDDARVQRAGQRLFIANREFEDATWFLRDFEQSHGIARDPIAAYRQDLQETTWDVSNSAEAEAEDARHFAGVWSDVRADEVDAPDVPETVLDEAELGTDRARAAAGREDVHLADADAAGAAAKAHRLAFPAGPRESADHVPAASAAASTSRTPGRVQR